MSQASIRASDSTDERTRMILGQIREIFDPAWIQTFESGRFTVQFSDEHAQDELVRFAEMHGFEMCRKEDCTWDEYYFE